MDPIVESRFTNRYEAVAEEKSSGATYTPKLLADFVARQITQVAKPILGKDVIRVLDPAIGDGELLVSLLQNLDSPKHIEVYGFDTDELAVVRAQQRLSHLFPNVTLMLQQEDFFELRPGSL